MGLITREFSYPSGKPARSSHCNKNEIVLYNEINGNLDFENLKAALVNTASGLVKLNDAGDVPLLQIPDTLTGKSAEKWDGHAYGDTYNIDADKELQHNSVVIVNTDGKVKHAVYN